MAEPVVWPFPAVAPLVEELSWKTEVLATRTGEQRIAVRAAPRVTLTLTHRLDTAGLARAVALARQTGAGRWRVPLWAEAVAVAGPVAATDMEILVDTTLADFAAPGWAALAADGGDAHPLEIAAVLPDRLTLAAPVGVDLVRAIVMPAREGIMTAPLAVTRRRQGLAEVTLRVLLTEPGPTPAPLALLQHQGLDVLTAPSVLRAPLAETLGQSLAFIDNGAGPVAVEPLRDLVERRSEITLVDHGPPARRARRAWLRGLGGRQRAFWLPTWGRELVPTVSAGAATPYLVVAPIAETDVYTGRAILIDLPTGPVIRTVTGFAFHPFGHQLNIAAAQVPVPAGTPVHVLLKVRPDADRIEMRHDAVRSETRFPVIEVPA